MLLTETFATLQGEGNSIAIEVGINILANILVNYFDVILYSSFVLMFCHQNGGDALLILDGKGNAVKVSVCKFIQNFQLEFLENNLEDVLRVILRL